MAERSTREEGSSFGALDAVNLLVVCCVLAFATAAAFVSTGDEPKSTGSPTAVPRGAEAPKQLAGALEDATGTAVPLIHYQRIASGSTLADRLLYELCEPDRIVAYTARSEDLAPDAYRYRGKESVDRLSDLEGLLALDPDLLLINDVANSAGIARLREAGLTVFDLGELRGVTTLLPNVRQIAALIGHPERGESYVRGLKARLEALERAARGLRPGALYLSVVGGKLFGGTRNTSFGDVLHFAGFRDLAATKYVDWPRYTPEQILQLDPEVIVTNTGMADGICRMPGFAELSACSPEGRVFEVDQALLSDPGVGLLEAAEVLFAEAHEEP